MPPRRLALALSAALLVLARATPHALASPPPLATLDPKVISYYPATGGWTAMWDHWDPARYRADLARVAGLGATSVRVIVCPSEFGFPDPAEPYVGRLRELVGIAASDHLTVQLTLFDWFGGGGYADIAGSERWARELLTPYAGDPRLAFVEVRNEIDPANPQAVAWARELIPFVRATLLDAVPVTISVNASDPVGSVTALKAGLAGAEPDFYTIHYYGGSGDQAYWTFLAAEQAVTPVPLWVGETGYPTSTQVTGYDELPETPGAQEGAQAHFLKTVAYASRQLGLPPPGIWTLDDFDPGTVPGPQSEPEYDFGLYRTDGTPKPAAAVVRSIFGAGASSSFNGDFERGVATATGGSVPAEWSSAGSANAQLALARTAPHGGGGDAVVRSLDGAAASGVFSVSPVASTPPGADRADASVWVRVDGAGAQARIGLQWLGAGDTSLSTHVSHPVSPVRGWVELRVSGLPPPGARSVRILLLAASSGCVWFDDVGFGWK